MIDLPADQLARVRDIVRQHVHGGAVFAFGSRVSGRAKKFSDLDLMIKTNGVELCYDIFGAADAEPMVLIMGLGAQMIFWEDNFCKELADTFAIMDRGAVVCCGPVADLTDEVVKKYLVV